MRQSDLVAFIQSYEVGEVSHEEMVAGFQALVDTGLAWKLQGSYGRMATRLIEAGEVHRPNQSNARVRDAYEMSQHYDHLARHGT